MPGVSWGIKKVQYPKFSTRKDKLQWIHLSKCNLAGMGCFNMQLIFQGLGHLMEVFLLPIPRHRELVLWVSVGTSCTYVMWFRPYSFDEWHKHYFTWHKAIRRQHLRFSCMSKVEMQIRDKEHLDKLQPIASAHLPSWTKWGVAVL